MDYWTKCADLRAGMTPRNYTQDIYGSANEEKAIGISFGEDITAIVLVSKTELEKVWLYVKNGSGAIDHVPNYRDVRQFVTPYDSGYNFDRVLNALVAQCGVALVGTDNLKDKHESAWRYAIKTDVIDVFGRRWSVRFTFSWGEPQKLAKYYWESARKGTLDASPFVLKSSDDLTCVRAILNGLVALGVAQQEAEEQKQQVEKELQSKAAKEKEEKFWERLRASDQPRSVWIKTYGVIVQVPREMARELVQAGEAVYN
jgi:hypothetical protein